MIAPWEVAQEEDMVGGVGVRLRQPIQQRLHYRIHRLDRLPNGQSHPKHEQRRLSVRRRLRDQTQRRRRDGRMCDSDANPDANTYSYAYSNTNSDTDTNVHDIPV